MRIKTVDNVRLVPPLHTLVHVAVQTPDGLCLTVGMLVRKRKKRVQWYAQGFYRTLLPTESVVGWAKLPESVVVYPPCYPAGVLPSRDGPPPVSGEDESTHPVVPLDPPS